MISENSSKSGLKTVTDSGDKQDPLAWAARRIRIASVPSLRPVGLLSMISKSVATFALASRFGAEIKSSEPLPSPRSMSSRSVSGSPTRSAAGLAEAATR